MDCAIFVTHRWSPSVARHFERLKREAGPVLDVYLAFQPPSGSALPEGCQPDIVVTREAMKAAFPNRTAPYGENWLYDCCELVWISAASDPKLANYDRFWSLEYDVDFSGDWSTFFSAVLHYEGDLLATDLRRFSADTVWPHSVRHRQPADAPTDPLLAFLPIVGFSRKLLELYCERIEAEPWQGLMESVVPSFAEMHGLAMHEIGGDGPFTPPERRGRHYSTRRVAGREATFSFLPVQSFSYFGDEPEHFGEPDRLYHPVKTDLPAADVKRALRRRRWVHWRDRILGRRRR
jgi:hypothetical protein